ncbi:AbrB family transcriptional regulator [Herbaspirillum autotrophicum]|uniref:AbrB family transcriptional regulator n=1 Tax=Herbaspirillum autotrophicum TaxID=180195 RepID=UPI00067CCAB1|nr:AbrB family transcriptional regulator [Herbaspirillum autotrophicum]
MMDSSFPWRAFLLTLLIGIAAALVCLLLHTPLPWMIGPLFATAAARMRGIRLHAPVRVREAGQWVIGTALGLYFTPVVLTTLASFIEWTVAAVLFAMLLGMACAWMLRQLTDIDWTTAFFAMAVGGASEMATQGERYGARTDRVAAAHSLRIMLVVVILPFGLKFMDVHGLDPYQQATRMVDIAGLVQLILLTSLCALTLRRLQIPNAWVIGPLLVTIALTACEIHWSALPQWMINGGQLLIGVSLGTRFTPEFLHTAPRYLWGVAVSALAAVALATGFGVLLAYASGMHAATAILATSPGGIAEMSLTAKTLQLGVPIVTAFHVIRMVALVLLIGPLFRLLRRLHGSRETD